MTSVSKPNAYAHLTVSLGMKVLYMKVRRRSSWLFLHDLNNQIIYNRPRTARAAPRIPPIAGRATGLAAPVEEEVVPVAEAAELDNEDPAELALEAAELEIEEPAEAALEERLARAEDAAAALVLAMLEAEAAAEAATEVTLLRALLTSEAIAESMLEAKLLTADPRLVGMADSTAPVTSEAIEAPTELIKLPS